MAETLTQAEIDALRDAVRNGRIEDAVSSDSAAAQAAEIKVVAYDFRKPQLLSAEHMLSLQLLHQGFSKQLQGLLFSLFKASADISITAMDQVSYGEFLLSLETPTCLLGLHMEADGGGVCMDLAPPLGQVVLDMLLGGDGVEAASAPAREFTVLELDVLGAWVDRAIAELGTAWSAVRDTTFSIAMRGIEPDQVQIVTPDSPCLCVALHVKLNEISGRLNICYPFSTLQAAFRQQESETDAAVGKRAEQRRQALRAMHFVPLPVGVELGRVEISAREIETLEVGDVLQLSRRAGDDLPLKIHECELGRARVGVRRGRLAAQVQRMALDRADGGRAAAQAAETAKTRPDNAKGSS